MGFDFRFPNITADTPEGQLLQVKSYLHQLTQQLNYAMSSLESGSYSVVDKKGNPVPVGTREDPVANFNDIKGLIIKSADIVNAYYEEISKKLEGIYVAEATFPDGAAKFVEETTATISASSNRIEILFDDKQKIESSIDNINKVLVTDEGGTKILGASAWVNIGVLDYDSETGYPIYGMEIGQVNEENGEEVYRKFAQYRSDGVHLFDQNGIEVVELSSSRMIIKTQAEFRGVVILGEFQIDTDRGFTLKHLGRG